MKTADVIEALATIERAVDFQLTNLQALANLMDEPTGLAIIYEAANKCGEDLAFVRETLAKLRAAQ